MYLTNVCISETTSRHIPGAPCREWLVLYKRCNNVDDGLPSRPKGASQIIQSIVAAFAKGATIRHRLRLNLDYLGASDTHVC